MTAREILKARGYSDSELDQLTLLNDAKFTSAIESEYKALSEENTKYKEQLAATSKWYQDVAVPTVNKALGDAVTSKAELARLQKQLETEQEYGMRRVAETTGTGSSTSSTTGTTTSNTDPDPRYVTNESFTQVAQNVGDGMAGLVDLAEDHRDLFGKRLNVRELRSEYLNAQKTQNFSGSIYDFHSKKYNVETRRTEIAAKEKSEYEAKLRADERTKVLSEMGNPNLRSPMSSVNPFTRKPASSGGTNGAGNQPWEKGSDAQRRNERSARFAQKVLTS